MPILVALCGLLAAIGILAAPPAPAGPQGSPSSVAPSVAAAPAAAVSAAPVWGGPVSRTTGAADTSAAPGTGGGVPPGAASDGSPDLRAAGSPRPDDLPRSLVYSGLFGLAISITGLAMIVNRRRLW